MEIGNQNSQGQVSDELKRQNREVLEKLISAAGGYIKFTEHASASTLFLIIFGALLDAILFGWYTQIIVQIITLVTIGILALYVFGRLSESRRIDSTGVSEISSFWSNLQDLAEPLLLMILIAVSYLVSKSTYADLLGNVFLIFLIAVFLSLPLSLPLYYKFVLLWYENKVAKITNGHSEIAYVEKKGLHISKEWIYRSTNFDEREEVATFYESELKGRAILF
jgi:hypothetical protein